MPVVSEEEVLSYLGVEGSSRLSEITKAMNSFIETECGRKFDLGIYEEVIELQPYQDTFRISQLPLVSLIYVKDSSDSSVGLVGIDYDAGIFKISSSFWDQFPVIEDSKVNLYVKYQAGYLEKPDDLRWAVLTLIEDRFNLADSSVTREKLGDRSYVRSSDGIPPQVREIINKYRIY